MTIFRTDYKPYPYEIKSVLLEFDLDATKTRVTSHLEVRRKPETRDCEPLVLDGEDLELIGVWVNAQVWPAEQTVCDDAALHLLGLPESCSIRIECYNKPKQNSALMGLYVSGASLFTQCEAEGFRRITYFADRPDVMSTYRVILRAEQSLYPTLLSNGNLVQSRELANGYHECEWDDPFPKPCYLFAIVAGTFDCRERFTETASGKPVTLQIYSDPGTYAQTQWAMESLERALRWDEQRFDLELDLSRFMVVVARDFNMGAMENKGLNVFNAAYVLADPDTSTDANYQAIEAVVGHEYFHNWTGNRVTCRDWFQLSLKEGLTVFRDQEFTADMLAANQSEQAAQSARAIKRIDDVAVLRAAQFPEDAGPMAHPIRPESYQEIGNFYTATVYEKGAEVIRMLHTLLGEHTFQQGMKEYFRRYDAQAVTCDDFIASMQWALQQHDPSKDLEIFKRWYFQAGTPAVKVDVELADEGSGANLTITQSCDPVGVEKESGLEKQPFHIPLRIGALGPDGTPRVIEVQAAKGYDVLLELTQASQTFEVKGISSGDILSINRGFTAPVHLVFDYTNTELEVLARHDPDAFTRWEALGQLYRRHILDHSDHTGQNAQLEQIVSVCQDLLQDPALDHGFKARLLSLPSDKYLLQFMSPMDPVLLAKQRMRLESDIGKQLHQLLAGLIHELRPAQQYDPSPSAAGARALRNLALSWLCQAAVPEAPVLARQQYESANNMTDRLGALRALMWQPEPGPSAHQVLNDFYEMFEHDPLVVDKWFSLQASAPSTDVQQIRNLLAHPAFDARNPNRLRALVFQFCINNPIGFHGAHVGGYEFWGEQVKGIDRNNPEVAARLARTMDTWSHHAEPMRSQMRAALQSVADIDDLSKNTREIVSKALSL
jgi:aminopeptidase N